ncbi:conjugal transfer protein (plasmid) [Curtobacterium sp. C1]|uniref:conjugal transfer protein n=1 Tax=Curtobacterium sp. C1 TaxID=2898151 RepID=UPI001E5707A0|nr:conjugal transfer protein [Curtobacterium sp. C1]UFU16035.1 conjugal transfer protein [Curtobacterium sp. C1]
MSEQHTPTVARFYTAARRIPVLIGKINGARIPGGPYTLTQIVVGGIVLWVGYKTAGLWGAGLYPLVRMTVLAGIAFGATWATGKIPTTRRRLMDLASDFSTALSLPELGSYKGKRISIARPHLVGGTVLMQLEPEALATAAPVATATTAERPAPVAPTADPAPVAVIAAEPEPVAAPELIAADELPENVIPIRRSYATGVERLLEQARRKESQ